MKTKMWFLSKVSLKKKVCTKWFAVVNIILVVAIVGLINLDAIIGFFGGNFESKTNILVIDNTGNSYETFETLLNNTIEVGEYDYEYTIELITTPKEEMEQALKEDNNKLLVILDNDPNIIKVDIVSNSTIDTVFYQLITSAINNTKYLKGLEILNISSEELALLNTSVEINRTILDENKMNADETMTLIMSTVFPIIILPFFMLSIFLVQMIGAEVNEEKTTRSMEVIISNVSPKVHFFSKMAAALAFVVIQGCILLGSLVIGIIIKIITAANTTATDQTLGFISEMWETVKTTGLVEKFIYLIPLMLILIVLALIGYALLAGILASMTTNMEDFQHVQTPIIFISLIGYYLSIMAGMFEGSILIKILSYVPFISPLLSPALLVLGQATVIDIVIAILIMIGTIYLLYYYGIRVYKVGILNYSSGNLWKKMFKALKTNELTE